ncbi:MAG: hypothetical protein QXQ21_10325 [Candidatus Jordarchaeales archaeon]
MDWILFCFKAKVKVMGASQIGFYAVKRPNLKGSGFLILAYKLGMPLSKKALPFRLIFQIMDPLIKLLKKKPEALKILGGAWEILYIERSAPDVGKRRENFLRLFFEKEFGLKVRAAPSTERGWDISIVINRKERKYNIKTTENIGTIKVAWNGFPSIERARKYVVEAPILYVVGNRSKKEISVFIFEPEDIEHLKSTLGDNIWWIPKNTTNPKGFGLAKNAVEELIKIAKQKENYASTIYEPINMEESAREYWEKWYHLVRDLALKPSKPK